jgi:hypothetical protein
LSGSRYPKPPALPEVADLESYTQVRYGLSVLLLAVFCPLGVDDICR